MNGKLLIKSALIILVLCLALGFTADSASAQAVNADKDLATKKGVGGSLGSKKIDKQKLPTKLEMGVAIGSLFVMIAVVKWV